MASLLQLAATGQLKPQGPQDAQNVGGTKLPPGSQGVTPSQLRASYGVPGPGEANLGSPENPGPYPGMPGIRGPQGPPTGSAPAAPTTTPDNGVGDFLHSPLAQFLAGLNGTGNSGASQQYLSQFQGALGAARANIQQQLGAALNDIANSQQQAGVALGQLPGQVNAAYNQEQGTVNGALGAIQNANVKAGMAPQGQGLIAPQAYLAPEQAAVQGSRTAALANVPLLQAGVQQEAAREQAQAHMAALGDQSALDQLQAQGMLGLAQSSQSNSNQLTPAQQFAEQVFLNNQQNQNSLSQIKAQQGNAPANTSPAPGSYGNNGLTTVEVQQAHADPDYKTYATQIANGQIKSLADLKKALPDHPVLWRTLAVDFSLQ